jgi:uncharacterized protein YbaP (TraB family)
MSPIGSPSSHWLDALFEKHLQEKSLVKTAVKCSACMPHEACDTCFLKNYKAKRDALKELALPFLGKRIQLWQKLQELEKEKKAPQWHEKAIFLANLLECHKDLMYDHGHLTTGFLWKVVYNGTPFYLVGSLHNRLCEIENESPASVETSLHPKMQMAVQLSSCLYVEMDLNSFATALGVSDTEMALSKLFPGLDQALESFSKRHGKEVKSLESVDTQSKLVRKLKEKVSQPCETEAEINHCIFDACQWGNFSALEESYTALNQVSGFLIDVLEVEKRSVEMVERIESVVKKGNTAIFALGALHMVGPKGALALLKNKGSTIEAISL